MVEEAQGAESKRDFVHKLSIAQKEARESHFWLRQLADADVVPQARLADLVDEGRQIKLVLAAIINATKRSMTREDE
jgi:four helix bundle protein